MPEVAAYLLEATELDATGVAERAVAVEQAVQVWLTSKGAADASADTGAFDSLSGGSGRFNWVHHETSAGRLSELRLEEDSREGQVFTTTIAILVQAGKISTYVTLAVASTESVIVPVRIDPRCPAIVRQLLETFTDWSLSGDSLGRGEPASFVGSDAGRALAKRLGSPDRALPVVVVSENDGDTVWSGLEKMLAYDLAGLAEVCRVNEYASWALTEVMGKSNSCYRGAIRLYWPAKEGYQDGVRLPGRLWTASTLLSNDCDGNGLERLRSELRRRIMGVAALAVVPPAGIREIKRQASLKQVEELENKAESDRDWVGLAKLYSEENTQLKDQVESLTAENSGLRSKLVALEYALEHADHSEEATLSDDEDEPVSPEPGEIRYYKKQYSAKTYDVLVPVKDCGHNNWQSSASADKAKKGIERLEGRSDWKNVWHCGNCTGGGLWKVRW